MICTAIDSDELTMNEYDKVASYSEQLTVLDEISKYLIELFIKKMRKIIQNSKIRPKYGFEALLRPLYRQ